MSTSRNILAEAVEAWRAIGQEERTYLLNLLYPNFSNVTPKEETAHRAALALLRAAAEPEARADDCTCSYDDSDEMTRHAPMCPKAGAW